MSVEDITEAMNDGHTWYTVFDGHDFWRIKDTKEVYYYPTMNKVYEEEIVHTICHEVNKWLNQQTNG